MKKGGRGSGGEKVGGGWCECVIGSAVSCGAVRDGVDDEEATWWGVGLCGIHEGGEAYGGTSRRWRTGGLADCCPFVRCAGACGAMMIRPLSRQGFVVCRGSTLPRAAAGGLAHELNMGCSPFSEGAGWSKWDICRK